MKDTKRKERHFTLLSYFLDVAIDFCFTKELYHLFNSYRSNFFLFVHRFTGCLKQSGLLNDSVKFCKYFVTHISCLSQ